MTYHCVHCNRSAGDGHSAHCPDPPVLKAGPPPATAKRTRIGLIGALDKAIWRAIDDGKDAVLLYVRTGGKPDIKVTIEVVEQGANERRDTQVLLETED